MEIEKIIEKIKNHENSGSIGMIASHLGIVRGFSRNGRDVDGVHVDPGTVGLAFVVGRGCGNRQDRDGQDGHEKLKRLHLLTPCVISLNLSFFFAFKG